MVFKLSTKSKRIIILDNAQQLFSKICEIEIIMLYVQYNIFNCLEGNLKTTDVFKN